MEGIGRDRHYALCASMKLKASWIASSGALVTLMELEIPRGKVDVSCGKSKQVRRCYCGLDLPLDCKLDRPLQPESEAAVVRCSIESLNLLLSLTASSAAATGE
jgi:hypothetical protein